MNLQRIVKQFAASATSQGIIFLQQILLPPIFIHAYGVSSYGEWITLYAAVAYLGTLQFGMQTYVNNELTMRYSRNEMASYQVMQSTGLRMLVGIAIAASLLLSGVFFLPISRWLHLSLTPQQTSTAIFFLGLQVIANLPLNYFAGTFMVFGMAHRGTTWQNVLRTMMVATAAVMALLHCSFPAIAIGQFLMVLAYTILILFDLRRLAPAIFPTLRYWDTPTARTILKPSGYFGLIAICNFMAYQLPILMLQRLLGPVTVVAFNIMRTIFSMGRQALGVFTASLGPEVTNVYGRRDMGSLKTLYNLSEKVLFTAIPVFNFTALLLSPILLQVWLHRPYLYSLHTYTLMAVVSCAISVREHKTQFQLSTNQHHEMARNAFFSYLAMIVVSWMLIPHFGLNAFLWAWLITEAVQAVYILHLNSRLFAESGGVTMGPLFRIAIIIPVAAAACLWVAPRIASLKLPLQGTVAVLYGLALLGICAWTFQLRAVLRRFAQRRARQQTAT
jgi:O-antigen/teichoic acid export membrane protein